jgi:hypothetical protein
VVVNAGKTGIDPEGALFVLKFEPTQEFAFREFQDKVELCPLNMLVGLAFRVTVGSLTG